MLRAFSGALQGAWDRWNRRIRYSLRGVLAYWGMIMMWVGIYNLLSSDLWDQSLNRYSECLKS